MENRNKVKIIILAAGKGVRMKSDLPKALMPLGGRPMITYLLQSVKDADIGKKSLIVVGYKKEEIIRELGDDYDYVVQKEQLGTAHALFPIQEKIGRSTEHVLVLPADSPFFRPETIKKLAETHLKSGAKITMATVNLPDFADWRAFFYKNFSRIIRDGNGNILRSVEFKDASEEEKKIREVNPIYFCFEAKWLWANLKKIKNDNAQKEYYLTDLIEIAINEKERIAMIEIDPKEALAANSKEELEVLERFV